MNGSKVFFDVMLACCVLTATPESRAQSTSGEAASSPAAAGAPIPPETLDTLLAPIALYPDALILQIVQCASSPYQVKQVASWLKQNAGLKGSAAQEAAAKEGFDASFVAIVLFPQVLSMMNDRPDWTRDLGQAFAKDREGVFASIQRLRAQAEAAGNLQTTEQQEVETVTTASGQDVIVIQPTNPQVVYVPQYDPQVVYVQTLPSSRPTDDDNDAAAAALIGFAAGVIVGAAADDDDDHYYYACGGWGYRGAALCNEGWEDYYRHRENMANDYYEHRENMARQRGENQANRQDTRGENQSARSDARAQNQAARENTRTQDQATRSRDQSARQTAAAGAAPTRSTYPSNNRATTSSRGAYQNRSQASARTTGTSSGAFSGYQRGSTERASSSRGRTSMSTRSGGGARRGR